MRNTRLSILIALALLIALLFSLRQTGVSLAGSGNTNRQQARTSNVIGVVTETKLVTPTIDTIIRTDQPAVNFGDAKSLHIGADGANRNNVLLYFQVEGGTVPYQSIVHSATLKLTLSGGNQTSTTISARSIVTDWGGITDTTKWENSVTWNTKPDVTATVAAQTFITPGNDLVLDITDLYAGWLNDPGNYLNYGLQLSGASASTPYNYFFSSRETEFSPTIEVHYTPQPTQIVIAKSAVTVTVDNACSPNEYPNDGYKFVDSGMRYSSVYVSHDDEYLYFCAENAISDYDKRFYALYIDTDLGKELHAEKDDLAFYTNPISKNSDNEWGNSVDKYTKIPCLISPEPESCDGSTAVKLANWEALSGVVTQTNPIEVAEYKIKLDLIGVNCQDRKIGMSFFHHWVNDIADDFGWPTDRWFSEPNTWIEASFAQLPASLPATCAPVVPFPTITPGMYLPLITR